MKVTIFGGTGFVGSYLIDALLEQGHQPVVLVHATSRHKVQQPGRCILVEGDITDTVAVRTASADADAVIYNIGILRESPARGETYEALHYEGAKHAIDAARAAGVQRFILMSANGVKPDGTGYQRSKYRAEQYLAGSGLDWTVFRPSVLFGDPRGRMEFATRLYREVVRSPLPAPLFYDGMLPTAAGMFRMSPVHVKDVAAVFVKSLQMPDTAGQIYPLCGPDALTWKDIVQTIAHATGTGKWALPAPVMLLRVIATALDRFAFFPITRDQLTMLMQGNTCDSEQTVERFGVAATPFNETSLSYLKTERRVQNETS
jgi:NADH dehydrogenase